MLKSGGDPLRETAMISACQSSGYPALNGKRLGAVTCALVLLAGCSSSPVPKADDVKVRQFAGAGYQTDEHAGIATSYANWVTSQFDFDVALTVPAKAGVFPVVIYLPALGETRSAGEPWRAAWAQNGYVVLTLQPLVDDARVWSSAKARKGDFTLIARERYSPRIMIDRVEALQSAMNELVARHSRRESPLEKIDVARVAVAGHDIGAYMAMFIAGESVRGVARPVLPFAVKAVIAMSPHADFSGTPFGERYAGIQGPVLSITSDNDTDGLGVVTSPSIRRAPFETMPGGGKYLLTLSGMPHQSIGGGGLMPEGSDINVPGVRPERGQGAGERSQDGGSRGGHRKGGNGAGGTGEGPRAVSERPGGPRENGFSLTSLAIGEAAIKGVTSAFLDAYVKEDLVAKEWLDKDASRWLRERGELRRR